MSTCRFHLSFDNEHPDTLHIELTITERKIMKDSDIHSLALSEMYEGIDHEVDLSNMQLHIEIKNFYDNFIV